MYNYRNFNFSDKRYSIFCISEIFSRTPSGKSWKSKPDTVKRETVNAVYYTNYITSIPFFNNFDDGAYCRATWTYSVAGYLPTTITTVSPNRREKIITYFRFARRATK